MRHGEQQTSLKENFEASASIILVWKRRGSLLCNRDEASCRSRRVAGGEQQGSCIRKRKLVDGVPHSRELANQHAPYTDETSMEQQERTLAPVVSFGGRFMCMTALPLVFLPSAERRCHDGAALP